MRSSIFAIFLFLMTANVFAEGRCDSGCEYVCNGGAGDKMTCECRCSPIPLGKYHCEGADMYAGVEWSEDIDSFPDYAIINYSLDGGHTQKKMTSTIIHGTAEIYSPDGAVRAMLDLSESSPKLILFNRLTNEPLKNPGPFDFFECK